MKIKDITISIFAIIGFVTILSSFNNQSEPQVTHGTPESHEWELHTVEGPNGAYSFNKITGQVKYYQVNFVRPEDKKQSFSIVRLEESVSVPAK